MYILPVVVLERGTLHSGCPRLEAQRASLFITKLGRKSSCVFVSEGEALQRRGGCSEFVFGGIYIYIYCLLALHFQHSAIMSHAPQYQNINFKLICLKALSIFNPFFVLYEIYSILPSTLQDRHVLLISDTQKQGQQFV